MIYIIMIGVSLVILSFIVKPADIEIEYKDRNGNVTKRKVKISEIKSDKIEGFCYLRNENRTFKINNILWLKDLKTNKIYDNPFEYFNTNTSNSNKNKFDIGYLNDITDEQISIQKEIEIKIKNKRKYLRIVKLGKELLNDKIAVLARDDENEEWNTFWVNQINELIDLETGEVISNKIKIKEYFNELYENAPKNLYKKQKEEEEKRKNMILNEYMDLLMFLIFVAQSDDNISSTEIKVIKEFFNDLLDLKLPATFYSNFTFEAKRKCKNSKELEEYIYEIHKKYMNINLLKVSQQIIATQKRLSDREKKILNTLGVIYDKNPFDVLDDSIKCPRCNSTFVIKKPKNKYQCQNCKEIFTTE